LIALLVATLAAFGLWYVELRPSSSASGGGSQSVSTYQSAINQAHQAVKTSNAANAKLGAPTSTAAAPASPTAAKTATATAGKTATATAGKTATATATAGKTATPGKTATQSDKAAAKTAARAKPAGNDPSTAQQVSLVRNAIESHKVVAVLFYNSAAADDQAMDKELAAVPTHGGKVVKLAVPVSELTSFGIISQQIPVVTAPTLVVIDIARKATTITGFADPLEISQRIDDALAAK
jgi:hypothetical protein